MGEQAAGGLGVRAQLATLALLPVVLGVLGYFVLTGVPGLRPDDGTHRRLDAASAATAVLPRARVNRFDGAAALALVRRQVAVGQRPAGSPQLRRLAATLLPLLPAGRFEPLPGQVGRTGSGLRNVVGVLPGRRPALVVGAHYDTESHPPGFVGADDSAAGTAVLVEVARALRRMPRPAGARELRFVLFDGEEEPTAADNVDFYARALRGSKAYVAAHRRELSAMVLLDYVGNKGLRLPREGSSDEALWSRLRVAAAAVGVGAVFPGGTQVRILDDHTPFLRAGIPAVDLIDFSYRWADGLQDTVDKLDVRALDAVGESVVELLRRLDRPPR